MPNLPVGAYDLTFEAQGFNKQVGRGVELRVTKVLRVDAMLEVGAVSQAVDVQVDCVVVDDRLGLRLVRQPFHPPQFFAGGRVECGRC